ncbi:hypothetical protein [Paraliomyxa miuraensis]|uniref:hypothetical protein n=1 Tax=Paraliomyxa miuraensis TaxID=376150 RepID=UPI00225708F7|nr:hypothetical protein [Paraliomyxa miuraensis]MCX4247460.1 hypothetical protein [Paraliomyxa miuraensis]
MRAWLSRCFILGMAVSAASSISCQSEPQEGCTPGTEGCECSTPTPCFAGLVCLSGLCVRPQDTTATSTATATSTVGETSSANGTASTSEDADSSGSASADTTEGVGGCQGTDGTASCPCLAGNECLGDLTCDSNQTCICLSGTPCGDSDCVEDFQTDNRHCGSCGNACTTFAQVIGACTDGECSPTLSDCVPTSEVTTCDAVCAAQGRSCVAQGCGPSSVSWVQYGNAGSCDRHTPQGTGVNACTDDLSAVVVQDFLRCCCTP